MTASSSGDADKTTGEAAGPKPWADERPGDAVCWLRLVCQECGTMAESELPADCPRCGARIVAAG